MEQKNLKNRIFSFNLYREASTLYSELAQKYYNIKNQEFESILRNC